MDDTQNLKPYDGSEREFLHDLANPLAIAYGHIRIVAGKLEVDINAMPPVTILEKLNKIIGALEKANALLDRRRTFLKDIEVA